MIDIDENGKEISEEDIKRWADSAEKLDFSEFEDVTDCIYESFEPLSEGKESQILKNDITNYFKEVKMKIGLYATVFITSFICFRLWRKGRNK